MTITPTFHFVCRYCGSEFIKIGQRVSDSNYPTTRDQLEDSQSNALEKAGCLDDVCRSCMPIYAKENEEHDRMKESRI